MTISEIKLLIYSNYITSLKKREKTINDKKKANQYGNGKI